MSRLDEVFETLHDLILERFRAERGSDVGKAFVAFEFGTPIPDDTFHLRDENKTLSPELAVEFLSQHANTVPEVKDMLFRRRPYTVEAQYGLMLAGAVPVEASSMEMLGAVKREAMTDYDQTLGSLMGPYRYRPVYATPVNWYDVAQSGNWTHIAIDRRDTPPPRPEQNPKASPRLRSWRIAPDAVRPALGQPVSATIRQMKVGPALQPTQLTKRSRATLRAEDTTEFNPTKGRQIPTRAPSPSAFAAARPFSAARLSAIQPARPVLVEAVARPSAATKIHVSDSVSATTVPHLAELAKPEPAPVGSTIDSLVAVDASWRLATVIEAGAKEQDVATDQFGISVDICLVNLHRPWLSDALLSLPGWYVPGFAQGEFSNADDEEDGPFAVLPTACILVRNLQIKAQWADEDSTAIEQSANLGTFNLFGRSFDRNTATLTVPGMQSIAWVCEPMPLLPPSSAP
jgi:hypothetical protein